MRNWFLATALCLIVSGTSAALWLRHEWVTPYYRPAASEIFVDIPRGVGSEEIADLLVRSGVLRSRIPFLIHLRLSRQGRNLKAGEYRFAGPVTPPEVAEILVRGEVYYRSVTIPEGLTADETVELIAGTGLSVLPELSRAIRRSEWIRDLDPRAENLEGYLFPETYRFSRTAGAEQIIRTMVDRFIKVFGRLNRDRTPPEPLDVRSLVTLASIVEKEAREDGERRLISSVLFNRLRLGMPLACDPTVIYALKLERRFDGNLRKEDLKLDSPYNTYVRSGLPPGPIANPGSASLQAALTPERTDFLYFVSRNDGTHQFSRDLRSHEQAVSRFQRGARRK